MAHAREMPRVAVLLNFTEKSGRPLLSVFLQEFRRLGWIDGETAHIDIRWGAGDAQRIRESIAELLALAPDIIVTSSTPPTLMLLEATREIQSYSDRSSIQWDRESLRACRSPVATSRDSQITNQHRPEVA